MDAWFTTWARWIKRHEAALFRAEQVRALRAERTELAERWPDLIDIDAGRIATGRASIEELGWELFHYYLDVASGRRKTWAERHRLHNDLVLFNPAPIT